MSEAEWAVTEPTLAAKKVQGRKRHIAVDVTGLLLTAHHETIVYWAMIITMTRRLARRSGQPPDQDRLGPGNALPCE